MLNILEAFGEPISTGGQEAYVFNSLSAMNRSGMSFDFYTPYFSNSPIADSLARQWGGSIFASDLVFTPGKSRENLYKAFSCFLADKKYDIVHIHSGSTSALAILARVAKAAGCKVIVHAHVSAPSMSLKRRLIRFINGRRMRWCVDAYCACSIDAARSKFLPFVWPNVSILKDGINVDNFSFSQDMRDLSRSRLHLDEGVYVIGNVARLTDQKNQLFLIDIFNVIRKRMNNVQLWIVGEGPYRDRLENAIDAYGLKNDVILWGRRDDIPQLLCGMDAYVFPSLFEGFGIAVLEAQASGLPCVISDRVPEDVNCCLDYVTSLSINDSATAWADHILHECKRNRNVNSVQQIKDAGFDISSTSHAIRQLYEDLEMRNGTRLNGNL